MRATLVGSTNAPTVSNRHAYAVAPKPTSVTRIEPQGAKVNPQNTNGRTGDRGVWQGGTSWVVESGSHA
jgi:hypothetical protein